MSFITWLKRLTRYRLSTMIVVMSLVAVWLAVKYYREPITTANLVHPIRAYCVSWIPRILSLRNSGSRKP